MSIVPYNDGWLGAMLREDLGLFARFVNAELSGNREYFANWHTDAIVHQLLRVYEGACTHLLITLPPRMGKTEVANIAFSMWLLGRSPELRVGVVTYSEDLSRKFARDCMRVIEASWFKAAFPNFRIKWSSLLDFETKEGGGRLSTSVGGPITGRGADILIVDDASKADDGERQSVREANKRWFSGTFLQRGQDDRTRMIVIQQRLHEDDLVGNCLRMGGWEELRLPAIATHDEDIPLTHGRVHHRKEGEALHPERQSLAYLRRRQAQDPYVFASQFQQDPIAREGAFVKPEWFGTYDEPPVGGIRFLSMDTAVKEGVRNSFSVGIVATYYQKRWYILDVFRKRVSYHDLKQATWSLCREYKVTRLLIEDASSGALLIQDARRSEDPAVPRPTAISPHGDKKSRFEAIASQIESGTVVLPRSAPWLHEFLAEITSFPGCRFKDQADALAQLIANPPPTFDDIDYEDESCPVLVTPENSYPDFREYESDGWDGDD